MDFDLSEEQRLLKESVDGLLNDSYDFDARKKYAKEKGGWSRTLWEKLARDSARAYSTPPIACNTCSGAFLMRIIRRHGASRKISVPM